MTFGKGSHLHLIDGSAFIFRAYHALPPLTRKSDGLPIGAVAGFCNMLWSLLSEHRSKEGPTHIACVFDFSSKTFRDDIYEHYKANRPELPEDLRPQFPLTREATRAFNVSCLELENYEADDIIATLARLATEAGGDVTINSSDKDLMQLVGNGVVMFDPMKNRRIGVDEVVEKFGVTPDRVIDVQALMGDSVDNVPGVKGIGQQAAPQIIRVMGSLEDLLDDARREKRLAEVRAEVAARTDEFAAKLGRPAKLTSKKDVADLLAAYYPGQVFDDLGNAGLDELTRSGFEAAGWILDAREKTRIIETLVPKVLENRESAAISKRLVTLDAQVPMQWTLEELAVRQPDAGPVLDFLTKMEFRTLTRRVAEALKVPVPAQPETTQPLPPADAVDRSATPPSFQQLPFDRAAYECVQSVEQLQTWIARIADRGIVAVDTETTSLDEMRAELVGISLSVEPGQACYVPLGHTAGGGDLFGASALVPGQLSADLVLSMLKPLLEDPAILKIGQNMKYDWKIFARLGIKIAPFDDTMLMSYALFSGLHNHGMDALSDRYLGHTPIPIKEMIGSGKSQVTFDRVQIDDAVRYAAEDADVTLRLWQAFRPRLHQARVTTVYETLERPLIPVLAEMEMAGIRIDPAVLSRMSNAFAQKMAGLEAEIHELAGQPFNVGSPKQLGEILFDKLGHAGGEKGKTGAYATGADVLEDLAAEGHELPARVLDWRLLSKLKSTYTDALQSHVHPETGRVHTSYVIAGANTGRLASTDPNLQNIPVRSEEGRRIREAFVAGPGMRLVSLDYSQIELRILAHVADIPALKQAFRDGVDIHAMTASQMFGVPLEGMDPMVRRQAKAINFGVIYGISGFGLARNLRIPRADAQAFIDTYFQRFPGIKEYMDATVAFARDNGFVQTLFGRKIHTPEINSRGPTAGFARRAAINAPIQGAAADVIRRAMIRMPAAIAHLPAKMLLQVHDELLFEVEAGATDPLIAIAREVMENAADPAVHLDVPLVVDAGQGANWAEAH